MCPMISLGCLLVRTITTFDVLQATASCFFCHVTPILFRTVYSKRHHFFLVNAVPVEGLGGLPLPAEEL